MRYVGKADMTWPLSRWQRQGFYLQPGKVDVETCAYYAQTIGVSNEDFDNAHEV